MTNLFVRDARSNCRYSCSRLYQPERPSPLVDIYEIHAMQCNVMRDVDNFLLHINSYHSVLRVRQLTFDCYIISLQIPGTEGKAGMVALVDPTKSLDLDKLIKGVKVNLPVYAQPLFFRIMDSVPLTGTFKLIKRDLVKEGFDVNIIKDAIYFNDSKSKRLKTLTKELYKSLINGEIKI